MLDLEEGVREIFLDAQGLVFDAIRAEYARGAGRRNHHGPGHAAYKAAWQRRNAEKARAYRRAYRRTDEQNDRRNQRRREQMAGRA